MFPGHPADPTKPDDKPVDPYPIFNDNQLLANYRAPSAARPATPTTPGRRSSAAPRGTAAASPSH